MKKVKVEAFDDPDAKSEPPVFTEAAECDVPLAWNGRAVTLDLSAAHFKEIDDVLGPYLDAGEPLKAPRSIDPPLTDGKALAVKAGAKRYLYQRMTDFAVETGMKLPREITKKDGTTSWYYPKDTRRAFNEAGFR
jgi:hypothetical protein